MKVAGDKDINIPRIAWLAHAEGLAELSASDGILRFTAGGKVSDDPHAIRAIVKAAANMKHGWSAELSPDHYQDLLMAAHRQPYDLQDPRIFFSSENFEPLRTTERRALMEKAILIALSAIEPNDLLAEVADDSQSPISSSDISDADLAIATAIVRGHFQEYLDHMLQVAEDEIGDYLAQTT